MRNLLEIIRFEYLNCVKNKAFIIITVVILALILGASFVPAIISSFQESEEEEDTKIVIAVRSDAKAYSNELVTSEFSRFYPDAEIKLTDDDRTALEKGVNNGDYRFAVILGSELELTYITKNNALYDTDLQITSEAVRAMYVSSVLSGLGIEQKDSDALMSVAPKTEVVTTGTDRTSNFMSAYILMCMLFVAITTYGNIVAQSVVSEKNTRAMELLITCAKPAELMFGKVIGSGLAGFTQLTVILVFSVGSFSTVSSKALPQDVLDIINFEPKTAFLAILFFVLGYFMFAFLIGALASFATKSEDLSNLTSPVMMIMVIIYMVLIFMTMGDQMDSPVMVVMSYLPLCSPMSMFLRANLTDVPWWAVTLSAVLQIVSTIIIGYIAAAIYRTGVLMYGKPPKISEIFRFVRQQSEDNKRLKNSGK